jgi:hypothetical protein
MKRNTQKAPARAGPTHGGSQAAFGRDHGVRPTEPPHGHSDPSSAIHAAAALIALAMHESQIPVVELGGALTRLASKLHDDTADVRIDKETFAREVAVCIESLQFHDRLMQQLTQVRNLLASLAAETLPASADQGAWNVLVENIRSRFTSDSHRVLFNLLLPVSGIAMTAPSLHANEGSIELF